MVNIKSLLVEFIMAFLLGIAGYIAMLYIFIGLYFSDYCGVMLSSFALLTSYPLGSSLGIFITKKYIFRTGKLSVLCLFTSLVFGFLAVLLCPALYFIGLIRNGALAVHIIFPLVPLFALIGYNAMAVLLRRRKESPK